MWAERGSRPTAVKQTEYEWAYISAAVNPITGRALGVITPDMDTSVMNDLLWNLSLELGEHRHAVLVWDGAGFHTSGRLEVPGNITLLRLPPYSPETATATHRSPARSTPPWVSRFGKRPWCAAGSATGASTTCCASSFRG